MLICFFLHLKVEVIENNEAKGNIGSFAYSSQLLPSSDGEKSPTHTPHSSHLPPPSGGEKRAETRTLPTVLNCLHLQVEKN